MEEQKLIKALMEFKDEYDEISITIMDLARTDQQSQADNVQKLSGSLNNFKFKKNEFIFKINNHKIAN